MPLNKKKVASIINYGNIVNTSKLTRSGFQMRVIQILGRAKTPQEPKDQAFI